MFLLWTRLLCSHILHSLQPRFTLFLHDKLCKSHTFLTFLQFYTINPIHSHRFFVKSFSEHDALPISRDEHSNNLPSAFNSLNSVYSIIFSLNVWKVIHRKCCYWLHVDLTRFLWAEVLWYLPSTSAHFYTWGHPCKCSRGKWSVKLTNSSPCSEPRFCELLYFLNPFRMKILSTLIYVSFPKLVSIHLHTLICILREYIC